MVGREKELKILRDAVKDDRSHFIAIYGRRRIGKTYLVRECFDYRFTFQHTGLYGGTMKEQIFEFCASLKDAGHTVRKKPSGWLETFEELKDLIRHSTEKRKIIFIDELSWMDTQKSGLISALENFWNGFASARKDVILIVCASATSWILSKVIHNKGGLYHRLTEQIRLKEFSLAECEMYVRASGLVLTRLQILEYYMIFGGVPYYWGFLQKGLSLAQNVDEILFSEDAPLKDEFFYLYASIFKNPKPYIDIIECLAERKSGLHRDEIACHTEIANSGSLTERLSELESCGFIRKYNALGKKKKDAVYQLTDTFTLFYYSFLKQEPTDAHFWSNQINMPQINTWRGLAFERVCLLHVDQIKQKLGISGVLTEECSWLCKADPEHGIFGSQIDLLIVRRDQVINLCEMKYSSSGYTVTDKDDRAMRRKISDLQHSGCAKYAIHPTYVTTFGLVENAYAYEIQSTVTLEDLFYRRRGTEFF